jgi:hypothetical protein
LLPFVDILATEKVPKLFLLKIYIFLSSEILRYFFCKGDQNALKLKSRGSFSRLFSDFQKWTFINVQNSKPFWTFVLTLLLKNTTNILSFIL